MSEKTAEQLAAADNLSLERNNTTKGHATGFVDVTLSDTEGKFCARHRSPKVSIGTYTGRFEAALERARFMRRNDLQSACRGLHPPEVVYTFRCLSVCRGRDVFEPLTLLRVGT